MRPFWIFNPQRWERFLSARDVARARLLHKKMATSQRRALAAYGRGDLNVAECWDARADTLAEELESFLSELELEPFERGDEEPDVVSFHEGDPLQAMEPSRAQPGVPSIQEEFAAEYAAYLDARAGDCWGSYIGVRGDGIERQLRDRLRAIASQEPSFRRSTSDAQLVLAAQDAYQEAHARRARYRSSIKSSILPLSR